MEKSKVLFLFFLMFSFSVFGQNLSSNSTGFFIYTPEVPLNNKQIKVFYHIPNGDITKMPIIFSFHGVNRNADDYRDYWISMANANGFMVFAPEFSDADFPTGDKYNLANIFDDGDNPSISTFNPKNEWTFSVIDPIFETIKADISGTQQKYNAWGHSAGSQFLHRFVTYMPESKLDIAVCSNAGWYTVPENTVVFPYGIQNGQLPYSDLEKAFTKKLIIHLGKDDNDPNAAGLRHNTIVDNQQGLHRLERGRYYFETSETTAQNMNVQFNWEKHEVSGISHEGRKMAKDALQYILMSSLSISDINIKNSIKIYPNPANDILNIEGIETDIKIYSILGSFIGKEKKKNVIDISHLNSGCYFLDINNKKIKFLKK
ncbi:T9SS type A sorting domain-containing protein [Polaribacter porphyrae]|uniref:Secretion system C-terminal sorting domain-containing protein n=1 Tax=Polaribacter porphyrae TaxID=1137780 RepID=A0A2S7WQ15_9FLAO|nr:T9SS type A sorting domain-containing protein [Polaribacter porphyrae]PQJ79708.1 hypothetical protein BTO18_11225 [Polaribacter porphyrae]